MKELIANRDIFNFKYLPEFAEFILREKAVEFVTVGIRFCREVDLPVLKPLSKFTEEQLVSLSMEGNRELLEALSQNRVVEYIEKGAQKWVNNDMGYLDQEDLLVEDLTLGFYLRRKVFGYFLDAYTKNVVMQKFIISELDIFTTHEELIAYRLYMRTQLEKRHTALQQLDDMKQLYKEGQEPGIMGNWSWELGTGRLLWSAEMYRIFEVDEKKQMSLGEFISLVHPDDKENLKNEIQKLSSSQERSEYTYRITTPAGKSKVLRGVSMVQLTEQRLIARCFGTCQDITDYTGSGAHAVNAGDAPPGGSKLRIK